MPRCERLLDDAPETGCHARPEPLPILAAPKYLFVIHKPVRDSPKDIAAALKGNCRSPDEYQQLVPCRWSQPGERPRFVRSTAMPLDPAVEKAMLAAVPDLHGFALALCRRADRAEDLVQEALLHAIDKIES